MEQIKHKLGDLVYVVKDINENTQDFKIVYGSIVSIYHEMNRDDIDNYKIIIGQEDYDDYAGDTIEYAVLTSHKTLLSVYYYQVFADIQDALDYIRKRMLSKKEHFEYVFNLEVASDTE